MSYAWTPWFGAGSYSPIGIDVGERGIEAVQLRERGNASELVAAASIPWRAASVPAPGVGRRLDAADLERVMTVLDRRGFVGDRIVLAAPVDVLLSAGLELPPRLGTAQREQLTRMELARAMKREPATLEVGSWSLPTPGRGGEATHVAAVGWPMDSANALLGACDEVGVTVEAVDVRCLALSRACAPMLAREVTPLRLIVDLGWNAAHALVMHHSSVVYERQIVDAGLRTLVGSLCKDLACDESVAVRILQRSLVDADSGRRQGGLSLAGGRIRTMVSTLSRELAMALAYIAGRYPSGARSEGLPVGTMWLCGIGCSVEGLSKLISEHVGVNAKVVTPADLASIAPGCEAHAANASLVCAMGLAQHGRIEDGEDA